MSAADNPHDVMLVGNESSWKRFLRATEIDSRVVGMVIALLFILGWLSFGGPLLHGTGAVFDAL